MAESKGVFDQSLDEMLELDRELDINMILDATPALESDEPEKKKADDVKDKSDKKDVSLKNINKVLDEQSAELEQDTEKVDDEVEKTKEKEDDEASASLEKSTDKTSSDAPFTVIFARDLVAQGLLSSFDENKFNEESKELGEAEALRNLIKNEININVDAAKADLDEGYQEYLELVGKGIPQETAGSLLDLKSRFDGIKADDLSKEENVELRRQVMTDYLKLTTSMPNKKIDKLVQSSIDLGEDVDESKENLTTLKKLVTDQIAEEKAEADTQRKLAEEENRRSIEALKENINALSEVIPGVAINKQTKVQMFEAITKPVQDSRGRTTNAVWAKRSEDPIFFDERLAYLYATGFFDKNKPWTKASQAKVTKEITGLEKAIKDRSNTGGKVGSPVLKTPEEDKKVKDNIESMRGIFGA